MEDLILKAIELLKQGKTGKLSANIFTVENAVVFRDIKNINHDDIMFKQVQEVIAIKTNDGVILGNSSRMPSLEDKRFKKIIQPARIQRILSDHITMIPFSVFLEAGLDLLTCSIIDSGPAETLNEIDTTPGKPRALIQRHFTGARLFKALPKTMNVPSKPETYSKYFLVDVDRREVDHNIINFFLAEIPEKCSSIEEAYNLLKPDEVKMFEQNTNTQVLRQGEFFFIPTSHGLILEGEEIREIRVGNSRPNRVEFGYKVGNDFLVKGVIRHTGREHADLVLNTNQWFRVVPNTSKANFQLTGDID